MLKLILAAQNPPLWISCHPERQAHSDHTSLAESYHNSLMTCCGRLLQVKCGHYVLDAQEGKRGGLLAAIVDKSSNGMLLDPVPQVSMQNGVQGKFTGFNTGCQSTAPLLQTS